MDIPIEATTDGDATGTLTGINGILAGWRVVDGTPAMGTGYTLDLYDGASTGPLLLTDSTASADRAATTKIPVHHSDTIAWVISSAAASSEGTLRLLFAGALR